MDSQPPTTGQKHGPVPVTMAVRQRLQKLFEHGQRCAEKQDHDYANELFSQCVVEDPGNLIYLQTFLANLQNKYGDNKKGAKLAGLKIKSHRSTLTKAKGKGDWPTAWKAACAALACNPWDTTTLLELASAYAEIGCDETQLACLRWALNVDPKSAEVNRHAAIALQRIGQFDQAIACWQRVEQAKPHDEEALQAISRLSVEKTIHDGGYESSLHKTDQAGSADDQEESVSSPEERARNALADDPANIENYLHLADILIYESRFDEVEQLLEQGHNAAGGGDLRIRERSEDLQLCRMHQQVAIAEQQVQHQPTDENRQLLQNLRKQANQVELEVYAAKSDRDPGNTRLKFELGLRQKQAGKIRDAITTLQTARDDPKRKALVLLELGECFQKIEQYKLALSNYELSIEACEEPDSEVRRLALYRAGVLSTGLRELDRAERHLTDLASLDFGYRDVADRLDKINQLRNSG